MGSGAGQALAIAWRIASRILLSISAILACRVFVSDYGGRHGAVRGDDLRARSPFRAAAGDHGTPYEARRADRRAGWTLDRPGWRWTGRRRRPRSVVTS